MGGKAAERALRYTVTPHVRGDEHGAKLSHFVMLSDIAVGDAPNIRIAPFTITRVNYEPSYSTRSQE
jgi:hypothetical protein